MEEWNFWSHQLYMCSAAAEYTLQGHITREYLRVTPLMVRHEPKSCVGRSSKKWIKGHLSIIIHTYINHAYIRIIHMLGYYTFTHCLDIRAKALKNMCQSSTPLATSSLDSHMAWYSPTVS